MPDSSDSPGWYPDPDRRGGQRWWNGAGWSDARRDAPGAGGSPIVRPHTTRPTSPGTFPPPIPAEPAGPPTLAPGLPGSTPQSAAYGSAASGAPGWTASGAVTGYGAYGVPPTPPAPPGAVLHPGTGASPPVNPYEPNPYSSSSSAPNPYASNSSAANPYASTSSAFPGGANGSGSPYAPGPPVQYYGSARRTTTNVLAIVGLVMSVIGISSGAGGIIGFIVSILALRRANRMIRENGPTGALRGVAIAGIVVGAVGLLVSAVWVAARIEVAISG